MVIVGDLTPRLSGKSYFKDDFMKKKNVVTTTMPSQNASHSMHAHQGSTQMMENGKYMSEYHRNNLTNLLVRMATFQRLKCNKEGSVLAVYTKKNRCKECKETTPTGTSIYQLPLNDIDVSTCLYNMYLYHNL